MDKQIRKCVVFIPHLTGKDRWTCRVENLYIAPTGLNEDGIASATNIRLLWSR